MAVIGSYHPRFRSVLVRGAQRKRRKITPRRKSIATRFFKNSQEASLNLKNLNAFATGLAESCLDMVSTVRGSGWVRRRGARFVNVFLMLMVDPSATADGTDCIQVINFDF